MYVAPDYRRLGGARLMISQLEELLMEESDIWSMEISFTETGQEEESLAPFLASMGFVAEDDRGQNIYTFTGFLGLSDHAVFFDMEKQLGYAGWELFGGNQDCERKMLRFGKEENLGYVEEFPITLLVIKPLMQKFADYLTHRDFLGAIMNLGIERSTIGDILIRDNIGYVFCQNKVAEYLVEQLDKIK